MSSFLNGNVFLFAYRLKKRLEMQDEGEELLKYLKTQDTWKELAQQKSKKYLISIAAVVHLLATIGLFFAPKEFLNLTEENIGGISVITLQVSGIILTVIVALSFATLRFLSDKEREFRKLVYDYSLKLSEIQTRKDLSSELKRKMTERIKEMFRREEFYYENPTWNKVHLRNSSTIAFIDLGVALLLVVLSVFTGDFMFQTFMLKFAWGFLVLGASHYVIILLYLHDQF